jgi:hypothetical protein
MTVLSSLGRRAGLVILVLAALGFAADKPPASDDDVVGKEKPARGKKVRVSVVIILASETNTNVDPKLRRIAREVRKRHPKLTGFRMANMSCKSLEVGVADKINLIDAQSAKVTVQRGANQKNRIQLKVAPPQMGEITYSTPCGKFLPIVTPFRTKNKDLLIIAIRVQPCNGGK